MSSSSPPYPPLDATRALSSTQAVLVEPLRPFANRSRADSGADLPRRGPPSPHRRHRGDSPSSMTSPPPAAALLTPVPVPLLEPPRHRESRTRSPPPPAATAPPQPNPTHYAPTPTPSIPTPTPLRNTTNINNQQTQQREREEPTRPHAHQHRRLGGTVPTDPSQAPTTSSVHRQEPPATTVLRPAATATGRLPRPVSVKEGQPTKCLSPAGSPTPRSRGASPPASSRPPPLQVGGGRRPIPGNKDTTRGPSLTTHGLGLDAAVPLVSPFTLAVARSTVSRARTPTEAMDRRPMRSASTNSNRDATGAASNLGSSVRVRSPLSHQSSTRANSVPGRRPVSTPPPRPQLTSATPKFKPKPAVPTLSSLNLTPRGSSATPPPRPTTAAAVNENPHLVAGRTLTRAVSPSNVVLGATRGFVPSGNGGATEGVKHDNAELRAASRKKFMEESKNAVHQRRKLQQEGNIHVSLVPQQQRRAGSPATKGRPPTEILQLGHFDSQSKEAQILHLVKTFQRQSLVRWTKKVSEAEEKCKRSSFLEEADATYLENVLSRNVAFMRNLESIISDAALNDQSVDCGVIRHAYAAFKESTSLNDRVNQLLKRGEDRSIKLPPQQRSRARSESEHSRGPRSAGLEQLSSAAFMMSPTSSPRPKLSPKLLSQQVDEGGVPSNVLSPRERHIQSAETSPRSPISKRLQGAHIQQGLTYQPLDLESSMFSIKGAGATDTFAHSPSQAGSFRSTAASLRSRPTGANISGSGNNGRSMVRDVWEREGSSALLDNSRVVTASESAVYYAKRKLEGKGMNDDDDSMADRNKRVALVQQQLQLEPDGLTKEEGTSSECGTHETTSEIGFQHTFGVDFRQNSFCPVEDLAGSALHGSGRRRSNPHDIDSASVGYGSFASRRSAPPTQPPTQQPTTASPSMIYPSSSDADRGNPRGIPSISLNPDGTLKMDVVVSSPSMGASTTTPPLSPRRSSPAPQRENARNEANNVAGKVANRAGSVIERFMMEAEQKRQRNLFQPPVDIRDPAGSNTERLNQRATEVQQEQQHKRRAATPKPLTTASSQQHGGGVSSSSRQGSERRGSPKVSPRAAPAAAAAGEVGAIALPHYHLPLHQPRRGSDSVRVTPTETSLFPYSPFLSEVSQRRRHEQPHGTTSKKNAGGSAAFAQPLGTDRSGSATKVILGVDDGTWQSSTRRSSVGSSTLGRSISPTTSQQSEGVRRGKGVGAGSGAATGRRISSASGHSLGSGAPAPSDPLSHSQQHRRARAADAPATVRRHQVPDNSEGMLTQRVSVSEFFNSISPMQSPGHASMQSPPLDFLNGSGPFPDLDAPPVNSPLPKGARTLAAVSSAVAEAALLNESAAAVTTRSEAGEGVMRASLTAAKARRIQLLEALELLTSKAKASDGGPSPHASLSHTQSPSGCVSFEGLGFDASLMDEHELAKRIFSDLYGVTEGGRQFRLWESDVVADRERRGRLRT